MSRLAPIRAMVLWTAVWGSLALLPASAVCADAAVLVPRIDGDWWQVAGNPDLGELTGPQQQPVDFAIWRAADGTWQLWSCIRITRAAGEGRVFHRWEGAELTKPDWKPMGIAMRADPKLGEVEGGLQAPHVVKVGDVYHMFYGDWEHICHAVSDDGKSFRRVVQPSGRTGMFTEGKGTNTRDIMMLNVDGLWHGYYTAFPNQQGAVYVRTTRDFSTWSESTTVAFGGMVGTNPYVGECPHVVERNGRYYLFRTQRYGGNPISTVYHSDDPKMFGINQDRRYLLRRLPVAAPEIIRVAGAQNEAADRPERGGTDFIAALNPGLDGIRIARLKWTPRLEPGEPLFAFDDAAARREWKVESGDLPGAFTNSRRTGFASPTRYFIGTAERDGTRFDDDQTGVIVSPTFTIQDDHYVIYLSGGSKPETLYVELVDAVSGKRLLRLDNDRDDNRMTPRTVNVKKFRGRKVYLKVVDQAEGEWGHVNFGGIFRPRRSD